MLLPNSRELVYSKHKLLLEEVHELHAKRNPLGSLLSKATRVTTSARFCEKVVIIHWIIRVLWKGRARRLMPSGERAHSLECMCLLSAPYSLDKDISKSHTAVLCLACE